MPRFLHTADWHLGLACNFAGERAEALRAVRLETARRIMALAKQEAVDFVLLCGDTFDAPWPGEPTVRGLLQVLGEAAPIPVYVLPGNHDPLRAGSLWEGMAWKAAPDNVVLLDREAPVAAPGCTLLPCPLRQKQSGVDPTIWIPARTDEQGVRIGVAHGALDTMGKPMNFPIPPRAAELRDLDYLALGDWHGLRVDKRLAYPGTPEICRFEEVDPGHVLLVAIDGPGAEPNVEARKVNGLSWVRLEGTASSAQDVEDLAAALPSDLSHVCVRVKIEAHTHEAAGAVQKLAAELAAKAFWADGGSGSVEDLDQIVLESGFLQEVDARLEDRAGARALLRRLVAGGDR